jgi:predicted HicB family RNase H-like nuclease
VRIEPDAMKRAFEHAKADGKALGQWLEEAIQEKIDREANDGERG